MISGIKNILDHFRSHNNSAVEIFLYIVVGLFGAVVDFVVFFVLLYFGSPMIISQWSGSLLGFFHNHLWHHFFVFKHNQNFSKTTVWSSLFSMIGVVASGPALFLLQKIYDNFIFNKVIIIGVTTIVLFCLRKFFVFQGEKEVFLDQNKL